MFPSCPSCAAERPGDGGGAGHKGSAMVGFALLHLWTVLLLSYDDFTCRLLDLLALEVEGPVNPYDGLYTELALDSFQALQLIVIIESLADAQVPPLDLPDLFTVQDAYDYYVSLREAAVADAT